MNIAKATEQQHRKKKYVTQERESPFPIPISSITGKTPDKDFWYQFTGKIHGEYVLVEHSGDISYLYRMGFFGRGLMSRGMPSVYSDVPSVHLPNMDPRQKPETVKVMRRRMYLRHMRWKKLQEKQTCTDPVEMLERDMSEDPLDDEFNSDIEYFPEAIEEMPPSQESTYETSLRDQPSPSAIPPANEQQETSSFTAELTNQNKAVDLWESSDTNQNADFWSCDGNELASDRHGNSSCESSGRNENSASLSWDTMEADENFWSTEPALQTSPDKLPNCLSEEKQEELETITSYVDDTCVGKIFNNHLSDCVQPSRFDNQDESPPSKRSKLDDEYEGQHSTTSLTSDDEMSEKQAKGTKLSDNLCKDTRYLDECAELETNKYDLEVSVAKSESDNKSESANIEPYCLLNSTAGANNWEEDTKGTCTSDEEMEESVIGIKTEGEYLHPYCRSDCDVVTGTRVGDILDVKGDSGMKSTVLEDRGNLRDKGHTERNVCGSLETEVDSRKGKESMTKEIGDEHLDRDCKSENVTETEGDSSSKQNIQRTTDEVDTTVDTKDKTSQIDVPREVHSESEGTKKTKLETSSPADTLTERTEYLVIDDSDIDDCTEIVQRKEKYSWKPVRKREVFPFREPLVLSFEEAFFLSYGLGCLTVKDEHDTDMNLTDLWCRFCQKQQFLPRYVAYHYFRSKGWVPKPSLLFGTDLLVYKVGPAFYHASYAVVVKTVWEGSYKEVAGYKNRKMTWNDLAGLNRVIELVAKTMVFCYVVLPADLSEEEKRSPLCISRIKVRTQAMKRWVSSKERDSSRVAEEIS